MPDELAGAPIAPTPEAVPATTVPPTDATAAPEPENKPERTFSQRELDEIVQKRINKIERRYERVIDKVLNGRQPERQPERPEVPTEDGKPQREKFADYEAYIEAVAEWKADQKVKAREEAQARARAAEQAKQRETAWQKRLSAAAKDIPDLIETLESSEAPLTPPMMTAITESDIGPKLAHWLAQNVEDAERIAGLSPASQVREIGKLEAKLLAEPAPKPKPTSAAPEPITPVGGKAPASDEPSDKDSDAEWIRKREAALKARRRR